MIINNFIRKNIFLFILLLSNFVICQNSSIREIDDLLKKAEHSHQSYKDREELELAQKANIIAQKEGNSEKIAESYYIIARSFACLELQKQSLYFVNKAQKENYSLKNPLIQAKLKEIKANDYFTLSLQSQGKKELFDIIKLLKEKKDTSSIKLLSRTYEYIGNLHFDQNNLDSSFIYYKRSYKEIKKLPASSSTSRLFSYYTAIGNAYLKRKKYDSALYYYVKSSEIDKKHRFTTGFISSISLGNYYKEQKQYEKALQFYLKANEDLEKNNINNYPFNYINKNIDQLYAQLGNKEKESEYNSIHYETDRKLATERARNVDYALNLILKDQDDEYNESQKKKYIWIIISISVIIILFVIIYNILRKNLKHKENTITEVTKTLQTKDEIISKKNIETEELQLKVNDAYSEVIELAQKNDPSFYFRFQEVYPEFHKKLLEIIPTLRTSELTLCAYTFLGLNIKDIAEYTYKSPNTIRNRKQSLRKKFSIPTEIDMEKWLKDLLNEDTVQK
ncbi:tetratricopeptide repeat protein [Chryseobacterium sp. JUb7]|uniref:tetratricopeptide repeat protein n=1 Tax=Chryseobacterium sp. JUb7 TaxID=2940599 RepID=UPI002169C2C1|nr:tetratricopeptide repeat protein [Chryseobacterium sp. JUb7]MCS3529972.1 tetratricopeptide (TPR) repeat protein [Chryseobacterium sp. JUb7]